jgi:hypothetical protein
VWDEEVFEFLVPWISRLLQKRKEIWAGTIRNNFKFILKIVCMQTILYFGSAKGGDAIDAATKK